MSSHGKVMCRVPPCASLRLAGRPRFKSIMKCLMEEIINVNERTGSEQYSPTRSQRRMPILGAKVGIKSGCLYLFVQAT